MKRTFTQKVKYVPSCAADSFDALLKPFEGKHSLAGAIPTEVNRRARTSAAMIGLAISMGASGLLLPQQGDEAMAVEPVAAEPALTSLPVEPSTSVSSPPTGESEVVAISTPAAPVKADVSKESEPTQTPVVEHQVKEGQTLWELSKAYEVQPEAIAASNNIKPSAVLPVGQTLKIPAVNGIVHEVKDGETVETLSESYGVEPTQLQASVPVSELNHLQTGEAVTVPGNVNDLLKARQEVALNRLKEKGNRLNDSLAELRSEESTNLSELATVPASASEAADSATPVTVPSPVSQSEELRVIVPQPMASANLPSNPVVIPVPTPEMAASPAVVRQSQSPVIIPVPTPEMAATPAVKPSVFRQPQSPVIIPVPTPEMAATPVVKPSVFSQPQRPLTIPVPTPEMAATPTVKPEVVRQPLSPVIIPVPTPEIAATPAVKPEAVRVPNLATDPATTPETAAQPQAPQPVVIETLVAASSADVYRVKPGDTLDAIARRHGLSRTELIQANGLNNPNLIRVNQPLRIPQDPVAGATNDSVTVIPGIIPKPYNSASRQEQQGVVAPTAAVPTRPNQAIAVGSTERQSQAQSLPRPVLAQSTVANNGTSTVVVDTKPSQSANSQYNPYIERLRADILRLREENRRQRSGGQSGVSRDATVPTVTVPVAPSLNNASTPSRINPEFNPRRYNETLEAELDRRGQQQQAQRGSIKIEVPPPEAPSARPQDLVATAPVPADGYNPIIRTPVGETVSPELPSLSAPDMYLPDSPSQFEGYIWPTKGVLTSGYGWRWGRMHKGIDIAAAIGTPVVAAAPGVVVSAGWNSGGYGNLVEIQHPDGSLTLYAHNNRILVRRGQEVMQGQQISELGSTGRSTGPHLHFEVHPNGRGAVNPIAYLPRANRASR